MDVTPTIFIDFIKMPALGDIGDSTVTIATNKNNNMITDLISSIKDNTKEYSCNWRWYKKGRSIKFWSIFAILLNIALILLTVFYDKVSIGYDLAYNIIVLITYPPIIANSPTQVKEDGTTSETLITEMCDCIIIIRIIGIITSVYGLIKTVLDGSIVQSIEDWAETAQHLYYQYIYDHYLIMAVYIIFTLVYTAKCLKEGLTTKKDKAMVIINTILILSAIALIIAGLCIAFTKNVSNPFEIYNTWFTYTFCSTIIMSAVNLIVIDSIEKKAL